MASELQDLLSRYVGQLVSGCGNPDCIGTLCDTGRRSSTTKPTRKWTTRSARAIALAVIGGPSPREHLCPHYRLPGSGNPVSCTEDDGVGHDPSSLEQLLCDTPSVLAACGGSYTSGLRSPNPTGLERWVSAIQPLLQPVDLEKPPVHLMSTLAAAHVLAGALKACLEGTPSFDVSDDAKIREGNASPSMRTVELWSGSDLLPYLDSFERPAHKRLIANVCRAIALRTDMERRLSRLKRQASGKDPDAAIAPSHERTNLLECTVKKFEEIRAPSDTMVLVIWLKKIFLTHWDGSLNLRPDIALSALAILEALVRPEHYGTMPKLPAAAQQFDPIDVATRWAQKSTNGRHLLTFTFLFDAQERALYFRTANHLRMQQTHAKAETSAALRRRVAPDTLGDEPEGQLKYQEEHYLLLNVSRTNTLRDAYDQLWQRRTEELFRPLRVRLGEVEDLEVGHDLGGVQIEFFNLVCREAFTEDTGMFTTDLITGLSYFRPGSLQPKYTFELLGVLVALAIYNGITLPISLPNAFYKTILREPLSLEDIKDGWPDVERALRYMLNVPGAEDDHDRVLPLEANGLRLYIGRVAPLAGKHGSRHWQATVAEAVTLDSTSRKIDVGTLQWPGWHFVASDQKVPVVTAENKQDYVEDYAYHLAHGSVFPQLDAFLQGFYRILDHHTISMLTASGLKALMEGSTTLDIDELRDATRYDGYDAESKYVRSFWRLLKSWPEEKQKQLVKFVTAAERIPLGGASQLTFVIQKATPENVEALPTSSTCFGTLQLPVYTNRKILDEKLRLAIEYGLEGFGTG